MSAVKKIGTLVVAGLLYNASSDKNRQRAISTLQTGLKTVAYLTHLYVEPPVYNALQENFPQHSRKLRYVKRRSKQATSGFEQEHPDIAKVFKPNPSPSSPKNQP